MIIRLWLVSIVFWGNAKRSGYPAIVDSMVESNGYQ